MSRPPRRPAYHPWREDRLGRTIRAGLPSELRDAAPGDEVWRRIGREIGPPPREPERPLRRAFARLRPAAWPGAFGPLSLGGAAALSVAALLSLVVFGHLAAGGRVDGGPPCVAGDPNCVWDAMSASELAIQPAEPGEPILGSPGWLFRVPLRMVAARRAVWRRTWADLDAYEQASWLFQIPRPPLTSQAVGLVGGPIHD